MKKHGYSILSNVLYLLKCIYADNKILLILLAIEALCTVVTPVFGIYLPKIAVDLVTEGADTQRIFMTLGIFAAFMMMANIVQNTAGKAKSIYSYNMWFILLRKITKKSYTCDYENIESAEGHTRYQKALNTIKGGAHQSAITIMIDSMLGIFTSSVCFIVYSSVLSFLSPFMVLFLILLTAINFAASASARKYEENQRDKVSKLDKKLRYIESGSQDINAGKDTRIYKMKDWFTPLRIAVMDEYLSIKRKIMNRYFYMGITHAVVLLLRDGVSYSYLIYKVLNGGISIGDFVLFFGAITGFSGFINKIADNVNSINGASVKINDLRDFLERSDSPAPPQPEKLPSSYSAMSVSFRDVDFSYGDKKILDKFNMEISAGEKIALVGVNGAGKTTIVKLLCGFYTPDSGEILINGININKFIKEDLFKLFSAVFQDITILPFTIAENISMSGINKSDSKKIWECLEMADLDKAIKKYEKGINSPITKIFDEDGAVLSGGQQQKLLMARALYKNAPILILDEPTAALDPIAESETYEKFHELSKGKTALYISHRLASTRFCDRIMFLKNGKVAEAGTHAELMAKAGEYANMFQIQSNYYNKNRNGTEADADEYFSQKL